MSRDELTGQVSAKQITHKFVEQHDADVREVTVSNGLVETVIITSDEHPFYVFSKGFTAASELKTNNQLVSLDYQILKVVSNKRIEQSMPMFNFEVADYHTYAVSEQNVWVHNDCLTPSGRVITQHASTDSLKRHGFKDLREVDDIIDNATHVINQADGAIVHVRRIGSGKKQRFDFIIEGEEGIVTGLKSQTKNEIRRLSENQGWESLPF